MICHTAAKHVQWKVKHELGKNELGMVHGDFCGSPPKNPKSGFRRSNQDQTETLNLFTKSLTYNVLMGQRWETTL